MTKAIPPSPKKPIPAAVALQDWVDVFRAGTHTDMKGQVCTFSQADLDQMVANHALGAAPAVLGHPEHDNPAYAWTTGVKRDGDTLYVRFADINPDFAKGIDSGAYRNRSVFVVNHPQHGWRLRHVGWLGAAPPAIDGLKPVGKAFSADEGEGHQFGAIEIGANALEDLAGLLRGLREQIIADKGIEAADAAIPTWRIDGLVRQAELMRDQSQDSAARFAHHTEDTIVTTPTQDALDKARKDGEAAAEARFSAQLSATNNQLAQLQSQHRNERINGQIAGWQKDGKVLPADVPGMAAFMATLEDGAPTEFAFSAADGKEVKQTPAAWFAAFMAARKPLMTLGVRLQHEDPPTPEGDPAAIAAKAHKYINEQNAAGLTVSYAAAVAHVSKPSA